MDPAAAPRRWFHASLIHRQRRLTTVSVDAEDLHAAGRPSFTDDAGRPFHHDASVMPATDSRFGVRTPFVAPVLSQEWRYTIPGGVVPDAASSNSRGTPATRRRSAVGRNFVPAEDIIDMTGDIAHTQNNKQK